ncbi:MAG: AbrB/MazE/SpoVT family DNA-binding domain-containing protein [Clostridia bacterium]|nr:AbrB/MazE/SpoVT family DNA-binding domain-containing protein [Clostridia bacterium]
MQEKFVGICKVGERGQIVIPKQIRDAFGIKAGDSVVILSDINKGIAIVKSEVITDLTENTLNQ